MDSVLFRVADATYSFEEAIDADLIQPVLYNWLAENNSYTEEDAFNIWLGYWFSVLAEDVQMLVYPVVPDENGGRDEPEEAIPEQWRLTLTAVIENSADMITTLGADTNATDGFDIPYDFPEPPVPPSGDWVTAYFHHEDWHQGLGRKFNRDIRAGLEYQDQVEWIMTVETSNVDTVILNWSDIRETTPADYSIILVDPESDQTIDMNEVDSYSYLSEGLRELIIRVSSFNAVKLDPYRSIPTKFTIASIHPNPFNATTTIVYAVPFKTQVNLSIFDLAGRKLEMVVEGNVSSGYHSIIWEPKELPSGMYLVRFEAAGFVQTKKLVMIR